MSTQRISDSLSQLFVSQNVVFWHDLGGEFASSIEGLALDGVQLVRLDEQPALRVKLKIESSPGQRWLLYSTQPEPEPTKPRFPISRNF